MATQQEIDQLQAQINKLSQKNNEMVSVLEKNNLLPYPKILIGVPILAWTHEFATSFIRFWTELMMVSQERKFHIGFEFKYRRPVDLAEEELAELAVDSGCTHLLLMDDDIYDVTAQDFFALLDADKDVVGGIMFTSGFPHAMCAFRRYDLTKRVQDQPRLQESCRLYEVPNDQRVGLQHVDLIPFGFTMIKTSVFKRLPKRWFKCDTKAPTDSHFADSCIENNIEYFAHFGVWLNHRGIRADNMGLQSQLGMHEAQRQKGRCIPLSPEQMEGQEKMVQQKMKEAEENYKLEIAKRVRFYEKGVSKNTTLVPAAPMPEFVNEQQKNEKELEQSNKEYQQEILRRENVKSNSGGSVAQVTPVPAGV